MQQDKKIEVPPLLLSAIVCESVTRDYRTGRITIKDIIETIDVVAYPVLQRDWMLYFELTDLHQSISVLVEVLDVLKNEEVLANREVEVPYRDPLEVVRVALDLPAILFHHDGEYRIKISVGKRQAVLLGERRVVCREIELPPLE